METENSEWEELGVRCNDLKREQVKMYLKKLSRTAEANDTPYSYFKWIIIECEYLAPGYRAKFIDASDWFENFEACLGDGTAKLKQTVGGGGPELHLLILPEHDKIFKPEVAEGMLKLFEQEVIKGQVTLGWWNVSWCHLGHFTVNELTRAQSGFYSIYDCCQMYDSWFYYNKNTDVPDCCGRGYMLLEVYLKRKRCSDD